MKNRAHSGLMRLVKSGTRKIVMAATFAGLVIVSTGMGMWTHEAYAAKAKAEMAAQAKAATSNDVMAKLNGIESEMQQQTRNFNSRLETLEYQNAKLAAYEVRQHSESARLELAANRGPIGERWSRPVEQSTPTTTDYWEKKTCFHVGVDAALKGGLELGPKGDAVGNVGADALGDGVDAVLRGRVEGKLGFDIGPTGNVEMEFCHTWNQASSGSGAALAAMDSSELSASGLPIPPETQATITEVFSKFPEFQPASVDRSMNALTNVSLDLSPQNVLQIVEDPSNALDNVRNLADSLPMPVFLRNLTLDASQVVPDFSKLNPANFCANFNRTGGPLSQICNNIPAGLTDLQNIANVGKDVQNVEGALNQFGTTLSNATAGISQLCGSVSNFVTGLNGASITVPQLASFQLPTGISFLPPPPSLIMTNVSIGPQTISNPFHFQSITCPTF